MNAAAAIAFCLLVTCGNMDPFVYPLDRVSTHPPRMLGLIALWSNLGEYSLCNYYALQLRNSAPSSASAAEATTKFNMAYKQKM